MSKSLTDLYAIEEGIKVPCVEEVFVSVKPSPLCLKQYLYKRGRVWKTGLLK